MKSATLTAVSFVALVNAGVVKRASVPGFDISHYQENVDFAAAKSAGARFVIIKATEGTGYKDPKFNSHYTGATKAGLIRGGYHFAHPGDGTGAAQADYFLANGGGWSKDGITLPGMLDLESESGHPNCWGLSASAMVSWIKSFSDQYHSKTGRYPMLYFNPSWWKDCTGDSHAFKDTNPLVLARYNSEVGPIPGGWPYQTIWQKDDSYKYGGDSDFFNGSEDRLKVLATG